VHDNHVHDIQSFGYGGGGLYKGEGSTDIVMERNLVHHTKTGGFFQHFGKENRIRQHFASGPKFQLEGTRPECHSISNATSSSGIITARCWAGAIQLRYCVRSTFKLDHNLYWNAAGKPPVFPRNLDLDQWRERNQDRHSFVADPLFADAKGGNFQLQPALPAPDVGFRPSMRSRRACDAGPAKFTIIANGNNLFGTSGPRSRHARARRRHNRITPLLH
jgi:hypothetical protein